MAKDSAESLSQPPGSRVSALAGDEQAAAPIVLPGPDDEIGFAEHIKPLFREVDRKSMSFAFDLWSHEDVIANAGAILSRLEAGTMPCDGAWPGAHIELFQRWIDSGTPP